MPPVSTMTFSSSSTSHVNSKQGLPTRFTLTRLGLPLVWFCPELSICGQDEAPIIEQILLGTKKKRSEPFFVVLFANQTTYILFAPCQSKPYPQTNQTTRKLATQAPCFEVPFSTFDPLWKFIAWNGYARLHCMPLLRSKCANELGGWVGPSNGDALSQEALSNLKFYKYQSVDKSYISRYILKHYVRTKPSYVSYALGI